MTEVSDADWIHGRPEWWRSTAGRPPKRTFGAWGTALDDGEKTSPIPLQFQWELDPSKEWKLADRKHGGKGWMRQRFKPPARSILLPCSWSLFFLISTVIPLVIPGQTPNDQGVAAILFLCAWSLIFIPAWMTQNEMPRGRGWLVGQKTIILFSIGALVFPLHIIVNTKIGWISYTFFCLAWYNQIQHFQNGFKIPSNRWILPFEHTTWEAELLGENWEICSKKWRNGPIAKHSEIHGLELHGTSRGNDKFIAFHYHGIEGWLNDPFTKQMETNKIQNFLSNPPILSDGKLWPKRFLQIIEDLESE